MVKVGKYHISGKQPERGLTYLYEKEQMMMKQLLRISFFAMLAFTAAGKPTGNETPLSSYSAEWSDAKYLACNTAAHAKYLTNDEKQIVYILNLARMNPKLFCRTVLPKAYQISSFVDTTSETYYRSLLKEMITMAPLPILQPDSL